MTQYPYYRSTIETSETYAELHFDQHVAAGKEAAIVRDATRKYADRQYTTWVMGKECISEETDRCSPNNELIMGEIVEQTEGWDVDALGR